MKTKRRYSKQGKRLIFISVLILILLMALVAFLLLRGHNEKPEIQLGNINSNVDIAPDPTPLEPLTFMVIDVGQGQSLFIDYMDNEVLIDAGSYNDGSKKVYKMIKNYVDGPIEYVIGTHSHEDHLGGMSQIYDNFRVKTTIYGDLDDNAWCNIFAEKAREQGEFINDENTTIELGPKTTLTIYDVEDNAENTNNNSVVCLLQHGQNKFFMSGDLEKEAEVKLRKEIGNVDVVVLSHHGSDTSNTNLDVLKPKLALASCSKDNEYGHINKETLERALKYSGRVFATYKSKTMILTSDGQKIEYNMDDKERLGEDDYGTVKVEGGN